MDNEKIQVITEDTSIDVTEEELEVLTEKASIIYYKSNFEFLNAHRGLRKGKLHSFLGTPHGGKSTLVRTLVIDMICGSEDENIGLFLSEETKEDFLTEFNYSKFKDKDRIHVLSELDSKLSGPRDVLEKVNAFIKERNIKILIFDNLTTSSGYLGQGPTAQGAFVQALKKLAITYGIPVVPIVHTKKGVTENHKTLIEMDDIRGAATLVNMSEFFYVMQSFSIGDNRINTIRISKHRGQEVEKKLYQLFYFPRMKVFGKDENLVFGKFKELFKERNIL